MQCRSCRGYFSLRWVKLYIEMLLVRGFLAIISWLNVEWRGPLRKWRKSSRLGPAEPGNLKRWLLYRSLSISSFLVNEWMSEWMWVVLKERKQPSWYHVNLYSFFPPVTVIKNALFFFFCPPCYWSDRIFVLNEAMTCWHSLHTQGCL